MNNGEGILLLLFMQNMLYKILFIIFEKSNDKMDGVIVNIEK